MAGRSAVFTTMTSQYNDISCVWGPRQDGPHTLQPQLHPPPPAPLAYGAVMGQPGSLQLMQAPSAIPGVPPGLEYLAQIDQLLVHQQVEIFEMLTGFETSNKYQVKNSLGQQVYFAAEDSTCCQRYWCGSGRSFIIHIIDNQGREVMQVERDFKCCGGCWNCCAGIPCCAMEVRVEAPVGSVVGYVTQQRSCLESKYAILDANREPVLRIQGPRCICQAACCTADVEFKVISLHGDVEVGKISKQWAGLYKELYTKADNFGINFPIDLDVRVKATLLAATFLIDFMHFEDDDNNNNRRWY